MKKSEPHLAVGNFLERSVEINNDPVSWRARIASKAQENPKAQFSNLMHHLTYDFVMDFLAKIPRKSSPGTDGMTAEASQKESWLASAAITNADTSRQLPGTVGASSLHS